MTQPHQDVVPVNRFYIQINGVNLAVFTEIEGLKVETDIFEYVEGGNNGFVHKLPGQTRVGNLTLKRGMVSTNELFNWYMKVASGTIERRNLSVIIYAFDGTELRRWDFFDAYPVRWIGPDLSSSANHGAVETMEIAHAGMQLGSS